MIIEMTGSKSIKKTNKLTEDWSKGLIINFKCTTDSVRQASDSGKIQIPAAHDGFDLTIDDTSLIVRFNSERPFDFLNVYKDVCEFHYNAFDGDIRFEVDGGIPTLNKAIKSQSLNPCITNIVKELKSCLEEAGCEIISIDINIKTNVGEYKTTLSGSKSTVTEAANPENADLNMKIAKTLATKLTKEPKYRADLEAAGFELYDSDWSTYKNWAVKGPNGKSVVLSKGYDNKPRIYNSAHSLATKDAINVFDFVNYLTMDFTDRHDYRAHGGIGRTNSDVMVRNRDGSAVDANFLPKTKTQQYHDLQKSVKDVKWDIDYYSDKIDSIHKQIAQLQKDADKYLDDKSMSKDKLMTKLSEIDTLLKSMGVRSAEESLKMRIKESDDYIDSPKYIADRYLDFDIPDMCADTLKVLDNMSESTLAELISACRTFYNTLDEICTLHS